MFVPELPRVFWAARLCVPPCDGQGTDLISLIHPPDLCRASHSELLRSVLVVDTNKPAVKPRLSWCAQAVSRGWCVEWS